MAWTVAVINEFRGAYNVQGSLDELFEFLAMWIRL